MERQRDRETDKQRYGQEEKWEDRQTEIETDLGETERWHSEKRVWKCRDGQAEKCKDREILRDRDRFWREREMAQ